MADETPRERYVRALQAAHAAGDTEAATKFAQTIRHIDSLPVVGPQQWTSQTVPDVLRRAGDVASFGGTDWLRSKLYGTPVEQERKATQAANERVGPVVGTGVDVATAYMTPTGVSKTLSRPVQTVEHVISGGLQSGLGAYGHGASWPEVGKATLEGAGITGALHTTAAIR
jgi:hypothetical protein